MQVEAYREGHGLKTGGVAGRRHKRVERQAPNVHKAGRSALKDDASTGQVARQGRGNELRWGERGRRRGEQGGAVAACGESDGGDIRPTTMASAMAVHVAWAAANARCKAASSLQLRSVAGTFHRTA